MSFSEPPSGVRRLVILSAMLMAVLLYLDRYCIGLAADYIREDLRLTQKQIGWFMSAFFWSYALAQVPAGWLSDRYGARLMLVIYIVSWSFFTAMIGAVYFAGDAALGPAGLRVGAGGGLSHECQHRQQMGPLFRTRDGECPDRFRRTHRRGDRSVADRLFDGAVRPPEHVAVIRGIPIAEADQARRQTGRGFRRADASENHFPESSRRRLNNFARASPPKQTLSESQKQILLEGLNHVVQSEGFYEEAAFRSVNLVREALDLLKQKRGGESLSKAEQQRLNRFLIEGVFPQEVGKLYTKGWRPVMIVYGAAGIMVAMLFWVVVRDRPEAHPWCNEAECELIASGRPAGAPSPHGKPGMVPWKPLLLSGSMWLCCLMQVGTNVGWVFLVTWLPRYLAEVHHVPILERGPDDQHPADGRFRGHAQRRAIDGPHGPLDGRAVGPGSADDAHPLHGGARVFSGALARDASGRVCLQIALVFCGGVFAGGVFDRHGHAGDLGLLPGCRRAVCGFDPGLGQHVGQPGSRRLPAGLRLLPRREPGPGRLERDVSGVCVGLCVFGTVRFGHRRLEAHRPAR